MKFCICHDKTDVVTCENSAKYECGQIPEKWNTMKLVWGKYWDSTSYVLTHCGLVTPYGDRDLVNIGSGNGLLPDGTKPLPEPMLTYHQ